MNTKVLHTIFNDYAAMNVDSLIEFKNLIEDFPYCQSAQILYLLNLKRLEEDTFDIRLPHTAIYVHDRQKLKKEVEKVEAFLEPKVVVKPSAKPAAAPQKKTPVLSIQNLTGKTISDILNLKATASKVKEKEVEEPKPETKNLLPKKAGKTSVKLPKSVHPDDEYLELMRREALAKINQRLAEVKSTPIVEVDFTETATNSRIEKAKDLIDKVIQTNPKISKVNTESKGVEFQAWRAKEEVSLREDFKIVSETLAQLYLSQGANQKAIEVYKNLSEKFPEKKSYFTKLIKKIKK